MVYVRIWSVRAKLQQADKKYRLRVIYQKRGLLCMLSHLEVIKALQFVIRRANLPFIVTNGFSPRMKISFGNALSLGIESTTEAFDLYLYEYINEKKLLKKLQDCDVNGLDIMDCYYVDLDEPSLGSQKDINNYVADIEYSSYKIPEFVELKKKKCVADYLKEFNVANNKIFFTLAPGLSPEPFLKAVFKDIKINKIQKL